MCVYSPVNSSWDRVSDRQGCAGTHRRNCKCAVPEGQLCVCVCSEHQAGPAGKQGTHGAVKVAWDPSRGAGTRGAVVILQGSANGYVLVNTESGGVCVPPGLTHSLWKLKKERTWLLPVFILHVSPVCGSVCYQLCQCPLCLCVSLSFCLWDMCPLLPLVEGAAGKAAAASLSVSKDPEFWAPAAAQQKTELKQLEQEITFLMSLNSGMTTPVGTAFLH